MKAALAAAVIVVLLAACGEGSTDAGERSLGGTCGLPKPSRRADLSLLPPGFVPEGGEVVKAREAGGRISALVNAPFSVQRAFDLYREAAKDDGYRIVGQDNEGFEAEVYMKKGKSLGVVQVRTSQCDDAVIVFVIIVADATKATIPTIIPSRSPTP